MAGDAEPADPEVLVQRVDQLIAHDTELVTVVSRLLDRAFPCGPFPDGAVDLHVSVEDGETLRRLTSGP